MQERKKEPPKPNNNGRPRVSRRKFLRRTAALLASGLAYSYFESGWIHIRNETVTVKNLPGSFSGRTFALLTDIHHGPFITLNYIQHVVQLSNNLKPDAILLGGDYVHRDGKYIDPCFDVLGNLKAPLGVFAVMGNHDHWEGVATTRRAIKRNGIEEVSNSGVWVRQDGKRLRIAGVDDFWEGKPDLKSALGDTQADETAILLSHNPDFVENLTDSRVGLVVSGHTHGGQVVVPMVGAPRVPSQYGQKYLQGLVKTETNQVFVSRGVGTVTPPLRFCCRPEIVLITVV
jgi:predicted MPP superfamily phosphohydrolase